MAKKGEKSPRKKSYEFCADDVIALIEEVIQIQLSDPTIISTSMLFVQRNLYPQLIASWEAKNFIIKSLMDQSKAIRQARYEENLLSGANAPVPMIWYGKFGLGLMEEQHKQKIEQGAELISKVGTIKIGFTEDEDDSE